MSRLTTTTTTITLLLLLMLMLMMMMNTMLVVDVSKYPCRYLTLFFVIISCRMAARWWRGQRLVVLLASMVLRKLSPAASDANHAIHRLELAATLRWHLPRNYSHVAEPCPRHWWLCITHAGPTGKCTKQLEGGYTRFGWADMAGTSDKLIISNNRRWSGIYR